MKISIVTDEISADMETAIELAAEWGVLDLELRGYGTQRVPLFSEFQKQRLRELLDEYGARVIAISPGLFKIPFPASKRERFPLQILDAGLYQHWQDAHSLVEYHLKELLPASIEYAKEIGAGKIIAFSFERGTAPVSPVPYEILECLSTAAEAAEKNGLELLIEVEENFWADTGERTAELLRQINRPALGVNWDPGNAIAAGDRPYPDGYMAVRDYVHHVHFKDVVRTAKCEYCYAVNGEIDWAGQIQALAADKYGGYISVEPHMQPKIASTRKLLERLRVLVAAVPEIKQE